MAQFCSIFFCLLLLAFAEAVEPVKIRTLAKGAFSGIQEPKQLVVTNATQFAELWKKHSAMQKPEKPAPEVNFEKETVLVVAMGQKRTGGYTVEITNLKQGDGKTEVLVKVTEPKPGGIQLQALTAPFHIAAVPKIKGPVKFKEQ